jgi:hypothetical protein
MSERLHFAISHHPSNYLGMPTLSAVKPPSKNNKKPRPTKKTPKPDVAINNSIKSNPKKDETGYEKNINDCLIARYTGSQVALARWLVVATFSLAAFGFWQVLISRDTARKQLRAYVQQTKSSVIKFEIGVPVEAIVTVKNTGQTPARETVFWTGITIREHPLAVMITDKPSDEIMPHASRGDLGSGSAIHSPIKTDGNLNQSQFDQIRAGAQAVYVFGGVTYRDIFDKPWFTDFCLVLRGERIVVGDSLTPYSKGNKSK